MKAQNSLRASMSTCLPRRGETAPKSHGARIRWRRCQLRPWDIDSAGGFELGGLPHAVHFGPSVDLAPSLSSKPCQEMA